MKISIKNFVMAILLIFMAINNMSAEQTQSKISNKKASIEGKTVYKIVNNDKILSDKGYSKITGPSVKSITVKGDTVLILLSEEALKQLDSNSNNYIRLPQKSKKRKR